MKNIIIFSFLLISNLAECQLINYKCNKQLSYLVGSDTEIHSIFYNDKIESPVFNMQYDKNSNFSECDYIDFYYELKGKRYDLQGKIFNQKYVMVTGYTSSAQVLQITNLAKTDDLFTIGKFSCKEYKAEIEKTGSYMVLYTTNLEDGLDYNRPMQEIQKTMNILIPNLKKGEIVVQIVMQMPGNKYWKMIDYLGSETINQEIILNEKNLSQIYKTVIQGEEGVIPEEISPTPIYCSIIGHNGDTDRDVKEKINDFFRNMCIYFDQFGNLDNKDFCIYFDKEIDRKAKFYKKHEILNAKQVTEFEKELKGYSEVNLKENLVN
ncbi:hypothetical protein OIU83_04665 [Flavobacterium sp. LS1R49]|uniref:Uncharacterized protein n=1 Tax=Flavobacterium shii TaxID=2987687 RepID=A0A9X2YTR1_9FLAO|nr:hypothetical protein [Flavobacterium shii]MCV9926928.1 hypothetical protein [Flavobacterium shii]